MKRILALLLTAVLLVLALTGCAYNYEKKSPKIVSLDKAAFDLALKSIHVAGEDFGDTAKRIDLVWDSVLKKLASAAGTDDKLKEGKADSNDVIYYCYYAEDSDGNQFFTSSNMKPGSEVNFQMGLSGLSALNPLVAEKILEGDGYDFAGTYKPNTDSALPTEGMLVSVSYTMQKGGEPDITVTNQLVYLNAPAAGLEELYAALAAEKVGTIVYNNDQSGVFSVGEGDNVVKFVNAKVDYVVVGTPFDVKYTDTENDTQRTSADGSFKGSLKDKELTYHIYPVSYIAVDDLSAETVVGELISSLNSDSLDVFKKDGNETELYTKAKAYVDAKSAYDTAKKAYDDAKDDAKTSAETTMNEKKTAMEEKLTELTTADAAAYDAFDAAAKTKAEERKVNGSALKASFFDSEYESLLSSYNASIKKKVYAAVYAEMEKLAIDDDKIPEKAVKNVYNELMDGYECTFYQGDSAKDTSKSNYKYYHDLAKTDKSGSAFELFLKAETGSETVSEAKEFVRENAKVIVKSTLRVYALADAYEVKLTNKEFKNESNTYASSYTINSSYQYVQVAFTEEATRTAILFDRLMAKIAGSSTNDAGELTWDMITVSYN